MISGRYLRQINVILFLQYLQKVVLCFFPFRAQLKFIKLSGSVNYLINCGKETLPLVLQQAQQVGIMSDDHSYIIMNPDFQTIDIDPYKHGGSSITGW